MAYPPTELSFTNINPTESFDLNKFNTRFSDLKIYAESLKEGIDNRVVKVNNYGLSKNDFTDNYKSTLDNLYESSNTSKNGHTHNYAPTTAFTSATSSINGQITLSRASGSNPSTFTVYTHPSVNHIPTGGSSGQFLKYSSSGTATWATPAISDITSLQSSLNGKFNSSDIIVKSDNIWHQYSASDSITVNLNNMTLEQGNLWYIYLGSYTKIGGSYGTSAADIIEDNSRIEQRVIDYSGSGYTYTFKGSFKIKTTSASTAVMLFHKFLKFTS